MGEASGAAAAATGGTPSQIAAMDPASVPPSFSVTTVAWAPSCGRSYHLIATGGRDGHVRVWRVKPGEDLEHEEEEEDGGAKWSASVVADFDEHKCVDLRFAFLPS